MILAKEGTHRFTMAFAPTTLIVGLMPVVLNHPAAIITNEVRSGGAVGKRATETLRLESDEDTCEAVGSLDVGWLRFAGGRRGVSRPRRSGNASVGIPYGVGDVEEESDVIGPRDLVLVLAPCFSERACDEAVGTLAGDDGIAPDSGRHRWVWLDRRRSWDREGAIPRHR